MKRSKKLLSVILAALLILSGMGPLSALAATTFSDVKKGHWASDYISGGVDHGYINGYEDGTFRPNNSVTRAEFCKMINNALGVTGTTDVGFDDVSGSNWFYDEVRRAVAAGYISGYEDNTFRAGNNITRQEAAVVISRVIAAAESSKNIGDMKDSTTIADWALDGVKTVYAKGYMAGDQNKQFHPKGNLSRAEAARIIESLLEGETIMESALSATASGQTYSDTLYVGNVTINSGSGGIVTFQNCRILGTLTLSGGEEVILNNTGVNKLAVNNSSNKMTVTAKGSASVNQTNAAYGCNLEESSLSGSGFTRVTLSGSSLKNNDVNLIGNFTAVTVSGQSLLNLKSGNIDSLVVASSGKGSTINLANKTRVDYLEVNGAADFTGKGVIQKAQLNVTGATFENEPLEYLDEEGSLVPTLSPRDGAGDVEVDGSFKLSFGETVYNSSGKALTTSYVKNSVIELRRNSATGTSISFSASLSSNGRVITITPDSDLVKNTKYYLIIKSGSLTNAAGATNSKQTYSFMTGGGLMPEVYPVNGSDTIPVTVQPTLTFSETISRTSGSGTINAAYLQESVLELRRGSASGTQLDFTASISNNKVITIKPKSNLDTSTKYYIILKDDSIKTSGGDSNSEQTYSFTTATTDILVPTIDPASGSEEMPISGKITLTFDTTVYTSSGGEVNASYLENNVFTLRRGSATGSTVSFDASISSRKVVTLNPSDDLREGTTYYLIMAKGTLADGAGSSRKSNEKLTFSFATATDSKATLEPTPTPANAATGVATNTKITLAFDEAIYQNNTNKTAINPAYLLSDALELRQGSSNGTKVNFSATIASSKTITITPDEKLSEDTRYYVIVKAGSILNSNGRENSRFTTYFTCGTADAALKPDMTPTDGTIGVTKDSSITLNFSEVLYNASTGDKLSSDNTSKAYFRDAAIQLRASKETGTAVAFSVDTVSSNRRITITPSKTLTEGTTYYVVIPAGKLKNATGTTNDKHVFSFTVGSGLELTITPKSGATGVDRNGNITLSFSEKVYRSNYVELNSSNISSYMSEIVTLKSSKATASITATISTNGRTITLQPTAPLEANTLYTLTIPANKITNAAGAKNTAVTLTFTTSSSVLSPTVEPADGKTGVSTLTEIKLSFGETLYNSKGALLTKSDVEDEVATIRMGSSGSSGTPVAFTATVAGNKDITLKPTGELEKGKTYYIILNEGTLRNSTNTSGTKNERQIFSFKTVEQTVIATPSIAISSVTADGKHEVSLSFAEAVYQADGTTPLTNAYLQGKLQLRKTSSSGTETGYTASISSNNKVITLTSNALLDANTTYYVTSASDILCNSAGNKNPALTLSAKTAAANIRVSSTDVGKTTADIVVEYDYPGSFTLTYTGGGVTNQELRSNMVPNRPTGDFITPMSGLTEGQSYTVTVKYTPTGGTQTTQTHTFVTDATSTDSTLSKIVVRDDVGTSELSASNPANCQAYVVPKDGQVTVTPVATSSRATITATGSSVSNNGNGSYDVLLTSGAVEVTIVVTAESGSKTTYTLTLIVLE